MSERDSTGDSWLNGSARLGLFVCKSIWSRERFMNRPARGQIKSNNAGRQVAQSVCRSGPAEIQLQQIQLQSPLWLAPPAINHWAASAPAGARSGLDNGRRQLSPAIRYNTRRPRGGGGGEVHQLRSRSTGGLPGGDRSATPVLNRLQIPIQIPASAPARPETSWRKWAGRQMRPLFASAR